MTDSSAIYQAIGIRIRVCRDAGSMTQEALADRLGLTRTSITNMERGKQRFGVDTLFEIASILDVQVIDLLPLETPLSQPTRNHLHRKIGQIREQLDLFDLLIDSDVQVASSEPITQGDQ